MGCCLAFAGLSVGGAEAGREFQDLDEKGGGWISFDMFCTWSARRHIGDEAPVEWRSPHEVSSRRISKEIQQRRSPGSGSKTGSPSRTSSTESRPAGFTAKNRPFFTPARPGREARRDPVSLARVNRDWSLGLEMPDKAERSRMFRRMDYNGNGVLSLAEIDKAVVELWPTLNHKPVLMRAYQAADVNADGMIGRREFKLLLEYVLYFHRLWGKFEQIDTDKDHRIDEAEFIRGCKLVGLSTVSETEAKRIFEAMDEDAGGFVRFSEFCSWCARRALADGNVAESPPKPAASLTETPVTAAAMRLAEAAANPDQSASVLVEEYLEVLNASKPNADTSKPAPESEPADAFARRGEHTSHTGDEESVDARGQKLLLPGKEERHRLFDRMDYNGNGMLSLAEIDKAVVELWPQFDHKQCVSTHSF